MTDSMSRVPDDRLAELHTLTAAALGGNPTGQEVARLDQLVCEDPEFRRLYVRYMFTSLNLRTWAKYPLSDAVDAQLELPPPDADMALLQRLIDPGAETSNIPRQASDAPSIHPSPSPLPPVIIQTLPSSLSSVPSFFGGMLFSYMIAAMLVGMGLLAAAAWTLPNHVQFVDQPSPSSTAKHREATNEPQIAFVGQVTGMVDCQWSDPKTEATAGAYVPLGRKYALSAGLMEITYNTGAKVILEGPVTYEVESPASGFLSVGKLTARLEKRSAVSGQQSEISNPQSLIPNPLFSVRTPTAIVTDLGTEFGVQVDKQGDTTSHVFRGSVRVQKRSANGTVADAGRVLQEHQSASVARDHAGAIVVIQNAKRTDFVRDVPKPAMKTFDLADVVAGGNGFSGLRGRGIDPSTGRPTDAVRNRNLQGSAPIVGDGKYYRVETSPLVDGVFIPAGRTGAVQVDSAGHTFAEFGETDGMTGCNIWAGGTIPVLASSMPSPVSALLQSLPPSQVLAPTKLGSIDYATPGHGLIFMHANNGITFDLEAIRRLNPGFKRMRFRAAAGNVEPVSETGAAAGYADLWVLVDGQVRFRRRGINGCSGVFSILFSLAENDRFLTLAATDGGNTMAGDWILFGNPVLEIVTSKQKGE